MIKEAFGAQVKQLRTERGMTQEELSQRSGLAIRFLQDVEAGNKQASIKTVFKLADGLGVTPDSLIQGVYQVLAESRKAWISTLSVQTDILSLLLLDMSIKKGSVWPHSV